MIKQLDDIFIQTEPDYIDPRFKLPYRLRRFDRGEHRYYHLFKDKKISSSYISITSLCAAVLPASEGLYRYYGNKGYEGAKEHAQLRAARGTFYHEASLAPIKQIPIIGEIGGFDFVNVDKY